MTDLASQAVRKRTEELHADLEARLVEEGQGVLTLDHPLVFKLGVDPKHAAELNEQYRRKVTALDQAFEDGNWRGYIRLHERQHRVDALIYILDELDDSPLLGIGGGDLDRFRKHLAKPIRMAGPLEQ